MVDDTGREELHKAKQDYEQRLADALSRQKNPKPAPKTSYGMDLNSVYSPEDRSDQNYLRDQGFPGDYPFTRGIRPDMYRGRLWTMRQYAGFDTVEETNQRFRHLLTQGLGGMNVAFDLPTQLGMDPDDPQATSEVGKNRHRLPVCAADGGAISGFTLRTSHTVSNSKRIGSVGTVHVRGHSPEPGNPIGTDRGHNTKRHPERVHSQRELHISTRAVTEDGRRSL
ncbi:MAG: hypothetical protein Ct9H300mP11_19040 [Chloroflexota bacterium]|nr:MAG: hypothetical protein Ct9H300mP11_19040 [Chloroflexota bacterium]